MKKSGILALLFIFSTLYAGTRVTEFHGRRTENNTVILQWATEEETDLAKFIVQRSSDSVNWLKIGEIKSSSPSSSTRKEYEFIDNRIYKGYSANIYYMLVMVDTRGQQSQHPVIVSITGTSGIRHTWGSIKAMFR